MSNDGPQPLTLATLGAGAAIELFDEALQQVLDNIVDPNMDATARRKVVLTVTFAPDEEREVGAVHISAVPKLAGMRPHPTQVFIGRRGGQGVAYEHNPRQRRMDFMEDQAEADGKTVVPIQQNGGEA